MKKIAAFLLAAMTILALSACNAANDTTRNNSDNTTNQTSSAKSSTATSSMGTSANEEIKLEYDFSHMNDKIYDAHINLATNDKVAEFDEDEPNYARIENEAANYVADLTLDVEAKDAYTQLQESAETENEIYEEAAFGKYQGYYSDDEGIYGYILLDDSDDAFNVFVRFYVYPLDDSDDYLSVYESADMQNILSTIAFQAS